MMLLRDFSVRLEKQKYLRSVSCRYTPRKEINDSGMRICQVLRDLKAVVIIGWSEKMKDRKK